VPQHEKGAPWKGPNPDVSRAGSQDVTAALLAEAAVLGAAILSTEARTGMLGMLVPDDFDNEAHRTFFDALAELHRLKDHVDQVTVVLHLCDTDRIEQAGGYDAVFDLTDPLACPHPSAWRHYAKVVREAGNRRRAIAHHLSELRRLGVVAA
jgi:replicative DNA helicase